MQTSVNFQAEVFAGTLVEDEPHMVESAVNAEATASMPFGLLVKKGTNDRDALIATSTGTPLGIVLHSQGYAKAYGDFAGEVDTVGVVAGVQLNVLRKGVCYVLLSENSITPASAVRCYVVADTGHALGTFGKTADGGKTTLLANARFLDSGGAGDRVRLYVDMLDTDATITAD